MKKTILKIISFLLALIIGFLCCSETVMADGTTSANSRTSQMFRYFRQERTGLNTANVSPDELIVFGAFLSNFMTPGVTKLSDFYSVDSDIAKTVSTIFFGSDKNAETIKELTKMLGDGITSGGGLMPLQISKDGGLTNVTMSTLVQALAGLDTGAINVDASGTPEDTTITQGNLQLLANGKIMFETNNVNFRLALAMALAVSQTETGLDVDWTKETFSEDKFTGIARWLALLENPDNELFVDGVGNIWFDTGNGDYCLFIPACLNPCVFDRRSWSNQSSASKKIPLVNAFYMGCFLPLNDSINTQNSTRTGFYDFAEAMSSIQQADGTKRRNNAITMCVIESPYLRFSKVINPANESNVIGNFGTEQITWGGERQDFNKDHSYLAIDATWSGFFYDSTPANANSENDINFFDAILKSASEKAGFDYNWKTSLSFTDKFAFTALVDIDDCLSNMYYFNTNVASNYVKADVGGTNWQDADLDGSAGSQIYAETLFTTKADNETSAAYNTVYNSAFKNYLNEVQMELESNDAVWNTNAQVDWSTLDCADNHFDVLNNLHVTNCKVKNVIEETRSMPAASFYYVYPEGSNSTAGDYDTSQIPVLIGALSGTGGQQDFALREYASQPLGYISGNYESYLFKTDENIEYAALSIIEVKYEDDLAIYKHHYETYGESKVIQLGRYGDDEKEIELTDGTKITVQSGLYFFEGRVGQNEFLYSNYEKEVLELLNQEENRSRLTYNPSTGNLCYVTKFNSITSFTVDTATLTDIGLVFDVTSIELADTGAELLKPYSKETDSTTEGTDSNECCPYHRILYLYYKYMQSQMGITNYAEFKKLLNGSEAYLVAPYIVSTTLIGNPVFINDTTVSSASLKNTVAAKIIALSSSKQVDSTILRVLLSGTNNEIGSYNSGTNNDFDDIMLSTVKTTDVEAKTNIARALLYGIGDENSGFRAFGTFKVKNINTAIYAIGDGKDITTQTVYNLTNLGFLMLNSPGGWFGTQNVYGEGGSIGPWNFTKKTGTILFDSNGTNGTFTEISGSAKYTNNIKFMGGLNAMIQSMYNYRMGTLRQSLMSMMSTTSKNVGRGQFVANQCNVWPSIYWSYMTYMLNMRLENGALVADSYSNPYLPSMNLATAGGGLDLSDLGSDDIGSDALDDMTMEEKQEDLINKALLLMSTEDSDYRNNWLKSMIDSWIISTHKSIIGTYTNSNLSFNMGVETGSTTYASVTGFISTPKLEEIEITRTIVDNYGVIYVILLVIALIYSLALIITGVREVREGILTLLLMAVILVFPQILLNNTIGLMNSAVDSMYSDRFNFWAIAKHQASLNALATAASQSTADYIVVSNIEMAKQVYSTEQGVRIKWPSPKKIDNFNTLFSDVLENPNSTVNLTIFKTLFNSYFNQEQYTYDTMETYSYRPYNAIASEAQTYLADYKSIYASQAINETNLATPFDILRTTALYHNVNMTEDDLSIFNASLPDNTAYSDNTDGSYAKVDSSVALAALLSPKVNELFAHNYEWDLDTDSIYEHGIDDNGVDATTRLYYAYSESVFYYFYNVLATEWEPRDGSGDTLDLKHAMLEPDTFEKAHLGGSRSYIRDFLGMEYLFEYVIPYLEEGNIYVDSYINKYGMDIERFDFNEEAEAEVIADGGTLSEEYQNAKLKKEEYGKVWMLYSPWVDILNEATPVEKASNKGNIRPLEASEYPEKLGRNMVFSELDLFGDYDETTGEYTYKIDYSGLTSVENKILKVLKKTYEDIMYLNNYWNYDNEVILTAAAMMATFNFNKEFSDYHLIQDSNILYPQNFELQNFNYDAFLRMIIMNSTGESLTDTTDLYTRVIGKTSVFTGLLLLLTDLSAVIAIPSLKLLILLVILLIGLAVCMTCLTAEVKVVPKKMWTCLLKPILLFALFTIVFAWVVSLFVGTGLTSYVGSSSVAVVTNDPSITFLLLCLVNIVYIIGLIYLFIMLFKIAKTEVKSVALAISGTVAGAVNTMGNRLSQTIKVGEVNSGRVKATGGSSYGGSHNGKHGKTSNDDTIPDYTEQAKQMVNDLYAEDDSKSRGSKQGIMSDLNGDGTNESSSSEQVKKPLSISEVNDMVFGKNDKSSTMNDMAGDDTANTASADSSNTTNEMAEEIEKGTGTPLSDTLDKEEKNNTTTESEKATEHSTATEGKDVDKSKPMSDMATKKSKSETKEHRETTESTAEKGKERVKEGGSEVLKQSMAKKHSTAQREERHQKVQKLKNRHTSYKTSGTNNIRKLKKQ